MKKILLGIFTFIILTCVMLLVPKTKPTGDGMEYLTMAISFKNHLSFVRTETDKLEAVNKYKNSFNQEELKYFKFRDAGYFKALSARGEGAFSYHFWGYSLLCAPLVAILSLLHINPVEAFKITNLLLILLMFYWILFRNKAMEDKNKIFLTLLLYFSPLWFYYKWTHPEVFTFTLLMIGLIDYYNKRVKSAVLFTALASVQNPAAALVPFLIIIGELINLVKDFSKTKLNKFIITGLISLIVFIPFIFYYYYFGTFSLIGKYATDLHTISLAKILSLFFDLNFGLVIYVPVIFGLTIYSVIKRNIYAVISLITVVLFAVIDSAQLNWNPGIMLIHRYSYWMIPVILFGCFDIFNTLRDKTKFILIIISAILITPWFFFARSHYAMMHTRFHPVANIVLNTFPALYNPQVEVFAERTLENEGYFIDKLPLTYYYNNQALKTLNYDPVKKKYYYTNHNPEFNKLRIKIRHKKIIYSIGFDGVRKEYKK